MTQGIIDGLTQGGLAIIFIVGFFGFCAFASVAMNVFKRNRNGGC